MNTKLSDLAAPAGRAFQGVAQAWRLTEAEQLAILAAGSSATLETIKGDDPAGISPETLVRISHVLGIFNAINTLLPVPARADAWIRKPNNAPLFAGRSALQVMASGDMADLAAVHRYLDSEVFGT